jgi:hypothetical protein
MRKVNKNRWFLLAALLLVSISAFSIAVYEEPPIACDAARECCKKQINRARQGEMLWDILSRQFSQVSFQ